MGGNTGKLTNHSWQTNAKRKVAIAMLASFAVARGDRSKDSAKLLLTSLPISLIINPIMNPVHLIFLQI